MSVSELAASTELSRPTADAAMVDLVRLGLAVEVDGDAAEASQRRRGRPARRFRFRADAGHVLGVDIGEEDVHVAVANLGGEIVAERARTVALDSSRRRRLTAVRAAVRSALSAVPTRSQALLVATAASPGIIDPESGRVSFCTAMPDWSDFDLAAPLRAWLGCPVLVENDANLAAVGETWCGVARECSNVVFFLLGSRIGAGLLVDGRLVRGHGGGAGELGFLDLWEESRTVRGDLARESANLVADLVGWGGRLPSRSSLRQPDDDASLSWGVEIRPVIESAVAGDRSARAALERFVASAGFGLVTMSFLLSPQLIVVGGGTAADEMLIEPLRAILDRLVRGKGALPSRLEASTLGTRAVVLGAVRHALEHVDSRLLESFYATEGQGSPLGTARL